MPEVQIVIDVDGEAAGSPGTSRTFPYSKVSAPGVTATLSLSNITGVTAFFWEIIDQPKLATAVLSDSSIAAPTFDFTQNVSGTYLVSCTINNGQSASTNAVAITTANHALRKLAAQENLEFNATRGWAEAYNAAVDAIDLGTGGGSTYGGSTAEFLASSVSLTDAQTATLAETSAVTTSGIGSTVTLTPSVFSGQVTVEIYSHQWTQQVAEYTVDLSDSTTYTYTDAFGFVNDVAGELYVILRCSAVAAGATATVSIFAQSLTPGQTVPPMSSVLGAGLVNDGLGHPQIALATSSGMTLTGDELGIQGDTTQSAHVLVNVNGAYVSGAVDTTTDQSVIGEKLFASVGMTPGTITGPPIAGTWSVGAEVSDSAQIKWRCTVAGTPGTWELADIVTEDTDVVISGTIAPSGGVELLELPVVGNVGQALWLKIWARSSTGTAEMQVPFTARIFETTAKNDRETMWRGAGNARQTALTALLPASQTYFVVNDNNLLDIGEPVCIYDTPSRYEVGRCSARTSGYIWVGEALVDASSWAVGSLVLMATEFHMVPWVNTDGVAANRQKILLEVRNDGKATDPSLVFFAQAKAMSMGVLR